MPLVKIREKYQVTLPAAVRRKAGVDVGDLLEAEVRGKTIVMTPKSVVDREIARGLEDVKKGRVYGPFRSAGEMLRSLHGHAKKRRAS